MVARAKQFDLGDIWLFSACSAGQIKTIKKAIEEVDVAAGKMLCDEGSVGREFFFIVSGTAQVLRNKKKVAELGPGNYFGELSLLDRKPRSAAVISATDMSLLVLDQRRFNGLLEEMPTLAHKLLIAMTNRLRDADAKAASWA